MPDFLFEILSEEIPARMQRGALRDFERLMREGLETRRLTFTAFSAHVGPRRLAAQIAGLPDRQPDTVEVRRGPRIDAPAQALAGFLRSTGLERDALVEREGCVWAEVRRPGQPLDAALAALCESVIRDFPWPKSMRSGVSRLKWVRPIRRLLAVLDGQVVAMEIEGLKAGDLTEGHRFMGPPGPVAVDGFETYRQALDARFVILDDGERRRRVLEGARAACARDGFELVEDEGLCDEIAGLVEWPCAILGRMDPSFLALPPEVVRTSMRVHQKYFAVRRPGETGLAPRFVVVANIEAADGGDAIAAGNAKVLSARLSDAEFFWREDQRIALESRIERLEGVTFHARIGSMADRARRIERIAASIAPSFGAPVALAALAGRLSKCDLVTGMVGEFPELQGVMGGYYAALEGRAVLSGAAGGSPGWSVAATPEAVDAVAEAVRDHYRPLGPTDAPPATALGAVVALADKLDTLVSFFAVGETPTGSRDPFALRRAALGVIRILTGGQARCGLSALLAAAAEAAGDGPGSLGRLSRAERRQAAPEAAGFILDRFRVLLREDGRRHDLLDAVFATSSDDLNDVTARLTALADFLDSDAGSALLAGYRRAANIIKAESRKGGTETEGFAPGLSLGVGPPAERALADAVAAADARIAQAVADRDYAAAMTAFSLLRAPVDAFFEEVLVNDPDPGVRSRRLSLLAAVHASAARVADFSKISG